MELAPDPGCFLDAVRNMESKINVQKQLCFCNDNNEEKDEEKRGSLLVSI